MRRRCVALLSLSAGRPDGNPGRADVATGKAIMEANDILVISVLLVRLVFCSARVLCRTRRTGNPRPAPSPPRAAFRIVLFRESAIFPWHSAQRPQRSPQGLPPAHPEG